VGVEAQVQLEMHEHSARAGDLYMLCSDGLSEMVPDEQLFTLLTNDVGLQKKASLLVAIANDNGGRDNISVVLARAGVAETPRAAK
jgi:serine/threonine protein phosphatase PrpC